MLSAVKVADKKKKENPSREAEQNTSLYQLVEVATSIGLNINKYEK